SCPKTRHSERTTAEAPKTGAHRTGVPQKVRHGNADDEAGPDHVPRQSAGMVGPGRSKRIATVHRGQKRRKDESESNQGGPVVHHGGTPARQPLLPARI